MVPVPAGDTDARSKARNMHQADTSSRRLHPEMASFGLWRRSRLFSILEIVNYSSGLNHARVLPETKIDHL
jgi:hypothetical protein